MATLARQDGRNPCVRGDILAMHTAARAFEARWGLTPRSPLDDGSAMPGCACVNATQAAKRSPRACREPPSAGWKGPRTAVRVHELRETVNAIPYVNRSGIPWEYPPHDFPPYKTVYDCYAKCEADGTTQPAASSAGDASTKPES
ncbi:transposase [Streptomyces sp. NPDC059564]|uniref:transposase n=1 Tax=Streptomyces sp. NPDC059564 TaxID=3346865 RepID=UPI0036A5DDC6